MIRDLANPINHPHEPPSLARSQSHKRESAVHALLLNETAMVGQIPAGFPGDMGLGCYPGFKCTLMDDRERNRIPIIVGWSEIVDFYPQSIDPVNRFYFFFNPLGAS